MPVLHRHPPSSSLPSRCRARSGPTFLPWLAVMAATMLMLAGPATPAWAQGPAPESAAAARAPESTVSFTVTAESSQPNDEMVARLVSEKTGTAPGPLNEQVLRELNDAIAKAGATSGVKARLGPLGTQPAWDNQGKRSGWRVRGTVVIEGTDMAAVSRVAGDLATNLQLDGVTFRLRKETVARERRKVSDEAMAAFVERAREVAAGMGYEAYELRHAELSMQGADDPPEHPHPTMYSAQARSAEPVPASGGETTIKATVSGTIALSRRLPVRDAAK